MNVLLVGTLDTKGAEFAFVRDELRRAGVPTLLADAGVMGPPTAVPDISREELFALAGATPGALREAGDRGRAVELAALGAAALARRLLAEGKLAGVFGMGGSAGSTIGSAAMRELPIGVPKLLVSTLASGQVHPYVGTRDVTLVYPVVDLAGLNRISRAVLANAAAAMSGMVLGPSSLVIGKAEARIGGSASRPNDKGPMTKDKPIIAATMFGVTTPGVEAAKRVLEAAGYEVLVFHATGSGGRAMEGLVRDKLVAGVLDLTTTELADELAGGVMSAGRDRLTAAALAGVPQVISVGALDVVNFGPPETVPHRYKDRRLHKHNPNVTLMRTTPEENDRLGKELAEKACAARGPTRIVLPLKGVSAIDIEGGPFWWPEADAALFASIRQWAYPPDLVREVDAHVNDAAFGEAAARALLELLPEPGASAPGVSPPA